MTSGMPVAPDNVGPKTIPDYEAVSNGAIAPVKGGGKTFVGPADDPLLPRSEHDLRRHQHLGELAALGRLVTGLLLRSYERGERVYLAMLARGYAGAMPRFGVLHFGRADVFFLVALVVVLVPARVVAA